MRTQSFSPENRRSVPRDSDSSYGLDRTQFLLSLLGGMAGTASCQASNNLGLELSSVPKAKAWHCFEFGIIGLNSSLA